MRGMLLLFHPNVLRELHKFAFALLLQPVGNAGHD